MPKKTLHQTCNLRFGLIGQSQRATLRSKRVLTNEVRTTGFRDVTCVIVVLWEDMFPVSCGCLGSDQLCCVLNVLADEPVKNIADASLLRCAGWNPFRRAHAISVLRGLDPTPGKSEPTPSCDGLPESQQRE